MSFGLTSTGFRLKRLENIKGDIERNLRAYWPNIDLSATSVFGQIVGVFSQPHTEVWEQMQKVYDSKRPSSAEGVQLDDTLSLNGLTRLEPKATIVEVGLAGDKNTVVPKDTVISNSLTGDNYKLRFDTTITNEDVSEIHVRVVNYVENTTYELSISGRTYSINSGTGGSPLTVCQALETAISNDSLCAATALVIGDDSIQLTKKSSIFSIEITGDDMIYLTNSSFECTEVGEKIAVVGSLTVIETPWTGLDSVYNFHDGILGRGHESDAEARIRRSQSLQGLGAGTLPAIVARIGDDIDGVSTVKGFENREDIEVDGRPPHCFEIVVVGGDNQEIANLLWQIKPAGIQTVGNVPNNTGVGINVVDSNGDTQVMHFSRPVNKYIFVEVYITQYDEEIFPIDGEAQIAAKIMEYGNKFTIGLDVIPQRFYGYIFQVPGIEVIDLWIAVSDDPDDPSPTYQNTKISIGQIEIANFDLSRISFPLPT